MGTTRTRKTPAGKPKAPTAAERKRRAAQTAEANGEQEIKLENGVAVFRVEVPPGSGTYQFVVQTIGDVRPTEISDTLAYGIKVNKEQRGLD